MNRLLTTLFFAVLLTAITTSYAADLSIQNKKELSVFGMRAMGMKVDVSDIKKLLSRSEIDQVVQAGLNMNGYLCAQITDIRPLKIAGTYEISCIAYRGGSAKKTSQD